MRYLDPVALSRLGTMTLKARTVVEGALSGLHRSPHHGSSVEFAEHKEYSPGDEIRHIDWKAYGKFDRYYVKRFEEETELTCYLLLDCSGSMAYRGAGLSKLEYGAYLCAALGYLLNRQQDRVGLLGFAGEDVHYLPPRQRANHLHDLLRAIEDLVAGGARSSSSCRISSTRRPSCRSSSGGCACSGTTSPSSSSSTPTSWSSRSRG